MADIHITVDGVPITVAAGTNLVDAARSAGIAIPVFCYHPRMQPVGMCRMCLVAVGTPRIDRTTGQAVLDEKGNPVIAMMPKLQTACTTVVSEGMVVYTETPDVKFAQNGILEFLLTSHPLDCPVCDKGGECPLQNLTMAWGPGTSRFDYTNKVHFQKPIPLSDLIYLDRERCILCGRCVRFQDEIAGDPVLGYSSRGRQWHIISKSDPPFDSKFSGNTTDICPVGALTTADFRFKARAWEVEAKPAICTLCPVGCNIALDMRHNEIKRVMPRENAAVNDIWICDKGRFAHHFVESKARLTTPLIRKGDKLEPASWDEALHLVAEKFAAIQQRNGGDALAGLAGERSSNEELYLFQRLFREVIGSNHLDHRTGAPGEPQDDDIGVTLGVGSGTNLMTLGAGTTILVLGADPEEEAPIYRLRLQGIAQRGGTLIVANHRPTKLDPAAQIRLRYRPGSEIRVVRAILRMLMETEDSRTVSRNLAGLDELRHAVNALSIADAARAAGVNEEELRAVARSFAEAENGIIVYGADALAVGPALTQDLGSMLLLTGKYGKANNGLIALLPGGNARGALDMGVRPDAGPGYQKLTQAGLNAGAMWSAVQTGRIRGMYVMGIDPAESHIAAPPALEKLDFLVVQDLFLTETAKRAHVVLPASSFAESDGTYTNAERRVQRSRQSHPLYMESRPNWMIVQGIAQALLSVLEPQAVGAVAVAVTDTKAEKRRSGDGRAKGGVALAVGEPSSWDYITVGEITTEIAERVRGYQGITPTALERTGKRGTWGRQTNEAIYYDGTNYENIEGVGIQYPSPSEQAKMTFTVKPLAFEMLVTDEQYPFVLLVQRLLYDNDPLLRGSLLQSHVPAPFVALNQTDAQRLGIKRGNTVRVSSASGWLDLPARVVVDLPEGSILIPANLPGAPLSTLQTGPRTRVTVRKIEG